MSEDLKNNVGLEIGKEYLGEPREDEKVIRKTIGLPITKQLVYYPDKRDEKSVVDIEKYQIVEIHKETSTWYLIEITTKTGLVVRLHSSYLIEMQKPSFIADMVAQLSQTNG